MKQVTVFGGRGFIGSHVVDNLLKKGFKVLIFDRFVKGENYEPGEDVSYLNGDIKDKDVVIEAINQSDYFINLAGLLGTSEMIHNPYAAVDVNITGALNVFEGARIYKKTGLQIAVGNWFMNNPYSLTKNTAERFALMYNKELGTDIRVVRGMNVFGEGQKHKPIRKIFPNLVVPALLDKDITIYGDGEQVMDLIYVKDIAEIIVRAATMEDVPNNIVYEAGVGGGLTINNAVEKVLAITGSKAKVNRVPMRQGEVSNSIVEISEQGWKDLGAYLGFHKEDLTDLDEAIEKSVKWYRENLSKFDWTE